MAKVRTGKGRRVMRHARVRRKVHGTSERPRLSVFRSLDHVYAQIIDDSQGITLTAASSRDNTPKAGCWYENIYSTSRAIYIYL